MKLSSWIVGGLLCGMLCLAGVALAHEHPPASMSGQGIQLFERDHAFSGSILEHPVFGEFNHVPFGGKIMIRHGEKTLTLALEEAGEDYKGTVTDTRVDEETGVTTTIETKVELVEIRKVGETEGLITIKIDGVDVPVKVVGKTFANGHFHEATFEATVAGKAVSFLFTGEACFGYSTNISMLVMGAYAHLLK